MTEAVERRERFLRVCLEVGAPPDKALAQACAMEAFITEGLVAPLMLLPPGTDPVEAVAGPAEPTPPREGGRGRTWNSEKMVEFEQMWAANADISDIAAKFNITKAAAYNRAHGSGLGRRRQPGGDRMVTPAPPAPAAAPDRPTAPPATATPAPPRPSPATLPDTFDLPAAAKPNGPQETTDVKGVVNFLMSRDVHIKKDPRTRRWLVEGLPGQQMTADDLIVYANKERRRIGQPALVYGL